jgi:hypothetical protein
MNRKTTDDVNDLNKKIAPFEIIKRTKIKWTQPEPARDRPEFLNWTEASFGALLLVIFTFMAGIQFTNIPNVFEYPFWHAINFVLFIIFCIVDMFAFIMIIECTEDYYVIKLRRSEL